MIMSTKSFFTKVVGVTFPNPSGPTRQDILTCIRNQIDLGNTPTIKLLRDNNNPFDDQAVAVLDEQDQQIGFLSRAVVKTIAPVLDSSLPVIVTISQITGGIHRHLGMNIKIEYSPVDANLQIPF